MTTYLLHGGRTSKEHAGNDQFFAQFTQLVDKETVNILLCYFSRPKEQWESLVERDTANIKKNSHKTVAITLAENPADLLQKLSHADVLYVAGGEAELIEPLYAELQDLKQALIGKVYAGSSMGAFLAADSYVLSTDSVDTATVHRGLGLLPLQMLCHWDLEEPFEKNRKLSLLQSSSEQPILVLNEFEFTTLYQ